MVCLLLGFEYIGYSNKVSMNYGLNLVNVHPRSEYGMPRAFAFIERWESQQALEAHMATEHFGTAVKTWEPLLAAELDVRIFEM